jgi:tetratricopeptide (TPR) repeat protein
VNGIAPSLLLAVLIAGCANPINQKSASIYYDSAVEAEIRGDFAFAERQYDRALINARLGHAPDAGISAAMYGLGRMKGYLCKFDEAEPILLESLDLEEKVTGPESGITAKRLFELARFYYDRGQFERSIPYFSRGIPAVQKLGAETSDPLALAEALDEYSNALAKAGRASDSAEAKKRSADLRSRNAGKRASFVPVRYDSKCPAK